jgi:hypothetical protein
MPMARYVAHAAGARGEVLRYLEAVRAQTPAQRAAAPEDQKLAFDGVSCTTCHQIKGDNFGKESSFDGGFLVDAGSPANGRPLHGKYEVDAGRTQVMHSSTGGFRPEQSTLMQQSELCATCHTLFTQSYAPTGEKGAVLAEQTPYLEWRRSDYAKSNSCQSCHMPKVEGEAPLSSVLGQNRPDVSQHVFLGGNAFMMRIFAAARDELGVPATKQELETEALRTERHLATQTATLSVSDARLAAGRLDFAVGIRTLAGHKFPTAYPSRRAWLHVLVRDSAGQIVFESGAPRADGSIAGNDNDVDGAKFEPHYARIERPDQVQIYESVLGNHAGKVTTGLISADHYLKDNRLLPRGFEKAGAPVDVAVAGDAAGDADFAGGGDRVAYSIATNAKGPLTIEAELLFQSIGYRWAQNLRTYDAFEPKRFLGYWDQHANKSAMLIAKTNATAN